MPDVTFPHLHITIQHLNRVAFTLFGLEIYWYGIIIAAGICAGIAAAVLNSARLASLGSSAAGRARLWPTVEPNAYWDFALYVIPICVIGARLYYIAFSWDLYRDDLLKIFALREGGLAIYGAVIAAFITALVYTRAKRIDFWSFADIGIVGLPIGQAIGRWGNFVNREAYGGATDSLFAMGYNTGAGYIQVHPAFLYESAWNLALFALLWYMCPRKRFVGQIAAVYVLGYGIGRFWIEALRTDQLLFLGLPVSMLVAALSAAAAVAFIGINLRRASHDQASAS